MKEEYDRNGFVCVAAVFTPGEVVNLYAECRRVAKREGANRPWGTTWISKNEPQYTLTVVPKFHEYSDLWRGVVNAHPGLLDIPRTLLGGEVKLESCMLISKPPETGQPFPLHQDAAFYGGQYEHYCITNIHLDTTTPENGPLRFSPGGHTRGLIKHVRMTDGKKYLPVSEFRFEDAVEVCARAGSVVAFSHLTPHASTPNRSNRPRTMVRVGYVLV